MKVGGADMVTKATDFPMLVQSFEFVCIQEKVQSARDLHLKLYTVITLANSESIQAHQVMILKV